MVQHMARDLLQRGAEVGETLEEVGFHAHGLSLVLGTNVPAGTRLFQIVLDGTFVPNQNRPAHWFQRSFLS
jgi:hypothetical protein